jgi:uncharacterized protein YbaP (TraB family)
MKKLKLFCLVLGFSFIHGLTGCASDPKYKVDQPYLFEIKKEGQLKGYLFGTVHAGAELSDLPKSFLDTFDQHDILLTEVDLEVKPSQDQYSKVLLKNPNEVSVQLKLKPDTFEKVKALFSKEMGPARTDFILKNGSIYGVYVLVNEIKLKDQMIYGDRGEIVRMNSKFMLDRGLQNRSKDQGKILDYLDQNIIHLIFQCLSENEAFIEQSLERTLNSNTTGQENFMYYQRILAAYREGGETLRSFLNTQLSKDFENDQCILAPRNEIWMQKIEKTLEVYNLPFIAVGAAHLEVGPKSLRSLLKNAGFETNPVQFAE